MAGVKDTPLQPKGGQQIVNPGSPTALTVPAGARFAMFNVEGANGVRFVDHSSQTVSASVGMLLTAGTNYWYTGRLADVRVQAGGAAGTLNVLYYA